MLDKLRTDFLNHLHLLPIQQKYRYVVRLRWKGSSGTIRYLILERANFSSLRKFEEFPQELEKFPIHHLYRQYHQYSTSKVLPQPERHELLYSGSSHPIPVATMNFVRVIPEFLQIPAKTCHRVLRLRLEGFYGTVHLLLRITFLPFDLDQPNLPVTITSDFRLHQSNAGYAPE